MVSFKNGSYELKVDGNRITFYYRGKKTTPKEVPKETKRALKNDLREYDLNEFDKNLEKDEINLERREKALEKREKELEQKEKSLSRRLQEVNIKEEYLNDKEDKLEFKEKSVSKKFEDLEEKQKDIDVQKNNIITLSTDIFKHIQEQLSPNIGSMYENVSISEDINKFDWSEEDWEDWFDENMDRENVVLYELNEIDGERYVFIYDVYGKYHTFDINGNKVKIDNRFFQRQTEEKDFFKIIDNLSPFGTEELFINDSGDYLYKGYVIPENSLSETDKRNAKDYEIFKEGQRLKEAKAKLKIEKGKAKELLDSEGINNQKDYRTWALKNAPDRGGDPELFTKVTNAYTSYFS